MASFGHGTALLAKSGLGLQAAGVGGAQYVPLGLICMTHSCNTTCNMQPTEIGVEKRQKKQQRETKN